LRPGKQVGLFPWWIDLHNPEAVIIRPKWVPFIAVLGELELIKGPYALFLGYLEEVPWRGPDLILGVIEARICAVDAETKTVGRAIISSFDRCSSAESRIAPNEDGTERNRPCLGGGKGARF
jgi:hypothetical protein